MEYTVTAYVNVDPDNFFGWRPQHAIALVGTFKVKAADPMQAASRMFHIGNRMGCDLTGAEWPSDVRSLSVGDVLRIAAPGTYTLGELTFYAVDPYGWKPLPEPTNPIVPIEGTRATSRG